MPEGAEKAAFGVTTESSLSEREIGLISVHTHKGGICVRFVFGVGGLTMLFSRHLGRLQDGGQCNVCLGHGRWVQSGGARKFKREEQVLGSSAEVFVGGSRVASDGFEWLRMAYDGLIKTVQSNRGRWERVSGLRRWRKWVR